MRNVLFIILTIGFITNCGGGGGQSFEDTNNTELSETITNPALVNEPSQIEDTNNTEPSQTIKQLSYYKKSVVVKVENGTSLLSRSQANNSNSGVFYKKEGTFQYIPCNKTSGNLYECKIIYYGYELNQNINIIFTFNLKLFNILNLEKIHKAETPKVVISEESTNRLKKVGIIQGIGKALIIKFPQKNNLPRNLYLNISGCFYK